MLACFTLMLGLLSLSLTFEAAHINSHLSWLAVNSHKPERDQLLTLVVRTANLFRGQF